MVVFSCELVEQTACRLREMMRIGAMKTRSVGEYYGDKKTTGEITVVSAASLLPFVAKQIEENREYPCHLPNSDPLRAFHTKSSAIVIIDEVHHANTYTKVFKEFLYPHTACGTESRRPVVGFSATLDEYSMGKLAPAPECSLYYGDAVDLGAVAPMQILVADMTFSSAARSVAKGLASPGSRTSADRRQRN